MGSEEDNICSGKLARVGTVYVKAGEKTCRMGSRCHVLTGCGIGTIKECVEVSIMG